MGSGLLVALAKRVTSTFGTYLMAILLAAAPAFILGALWYLLMRDLTDDGAGALSSALAAGLVSLFFLAVPLRGLMGRNERGSGRHED